MNITKEEAIEQLKRDAEYCKAYPITCGENAYKCYELAIDALEKQITEKAEWDYDGHHIRCPICNVYFCILDREGDKIPTNFCPHCGADMRES